MIYFSQRDPKWAADKIGSSNLTIGRWGCTLTSIAMLSSYFGCPQTPLEIAHNAANFNKEGLVVWKNLNFPCFQFVFRGYNESVSRIKDAMEDPDKAVLLQVNYGQHWVVGIRPKFFGRSYIVADPWDGKKVDVLAKYHNIMGAAYFKRV